MLLFLPHIFAKNYAILLNASRFYYNYRHYTNIVLVNTILEKNKFSESDIVVLTQENPIENIRNVHPNRILLAEPKNKIAMNIKEKPDVSEDASISFENNSISNEEPYSISSEKPYSISSEEPYSISSEEPYSISSEEPYSTENNLIDDNAVKYKRFKTTELKFQTILNVLYLNDPKLQTLDENDNLTIYICGHGGATMFRVVSAYFIFRDDFMAVLRFLSKRLNKVLLIMDTCKAETLIERSELPENVYAVTTSLSGEESYSHDFIPSLGLNGADSFPYYLYKLLLQLKDRDKSLDALFDEIKKNMDSSTLTHSTKEWKVREFFYQDENSKWEPRPFVL
ncbi:GPI-anchor transamidase subunit K [Enteropsectra breve]|nr:GPI-anchor transamidase subunit K [Enteropsectra breve]